MPDLTNQQLLEAMLTAMRLEFATKQDIANMATKDDIKDMATKSDIKNMATKEDIIAVRKDMATKEDLAAMGQRLERQIKSSRTVNIHHHLETRQAIGELNRKYTNLIDGLAHAAQLE